LGLRSRRRRLREECIGLGLGLGEVDLYKLSSQFSAVGSRDERSTMTDERWAGGVFLALKKWAAGRLFIVRYGSQSHDKHT
jgi:hypothetical protein